MEIIRCGYGHYYNPELHATCPECARMASSDITIRFRNSHILQNCGPLEYVASGSCGKVYRTEIDGKVHALKVIDCGHDREKLRLAENEIFLMKRLPDSENVVPLIDHEILEDRGGTVVLLLEPFMTSFEEYCKTHKMTLQNILQLGLDICAALQNCWNANVAYLDVQPKNLFVDPNGRFCLGDFSSAVLKTTL